MFGKSLFKQSCKANGLMWIIITVAVCFMLCCVMLIAGNGSLGETKVSIENAVIEGEVSSQIQSRAINHYNTTEKGLEVFTATYTSAYAANLAAGSDDAAARKSAYQTAVVGLIGTDPKNTIDPQSYYGKVVAAMSERDDYKAMTEEEKAQTKSETLSMIVGVLNPITANGAYEADPVYLAIRLKYDKDLVLPRYDPILSEGVAAYAAAASGDADAQSKMASYTEKRRQYAFTNTMALISSSLVSDNTVDAMVEKLSAYGIDREGYAKLGFTDYGYVKATVAEALVNYRANLDYRIANIKDGETADGIQAELVAQFSGGLLASLPQDVSNALEEIGSADLYGTLVGSIFFKMAGLLLPIIYMIMTANALIAGQVDSGSMAYILSSGTKRKEVTFTQAMYLIGSILAMFLCTFLSSVVCFAIVSGEVGSGLSYGKLALINLGAFFVMFAMSGICFMASCYFNRSKHSMAIGGGLNMFFLVATMLGLFGSPVLPSIIRMNALNAFNYVSIISLFDVVSILDGTYAYLWKWAILVVIGIVCYVAGSLKFQKKDLPL